MNEIEEYYKNLMADIRREADANGILTLEAFFDRMTERLTEAGELEVAHQAFFQSGESSGKLRIDGYSGDPRDTEGVLGLIVCDFKESDGVESFDSSKLAPLLNPLIRFFRRAKTEEFRDSLNEVSPAFQVSDTIIATWSHIVKIKLILISNRRFVGQGDTVQLTDSGGVPITYSVWDLARFERFDRAGQVREDLKIDFARDFGAPLPALKASQSGASLESYLMIVAGAQLAAIYDRWGARLLEANVRTFLQARAKTNKGIQRTIRDEPELFFPYNNGLSATADAVSCVRTEAGLAIASISNLQIVNGAQTTGTIHAGLKTAKDQLAHVFVQMKLTVVPPDRAEDVVPKISEFANTQNKVNAADFFSNHPFHIKIEQFSRNVVFAAREGERHDTKWFYERSRGQFMNARARLTDAQQKKFDLEFPKAQFFSKTDLAKFEFSAAGKPHIVSHGAQKNFAEFARDVGESWSKSEVKYDEAWYRRLVSKAIVFRYLEASVPKQIWYNGGYRANVVTYAMAKVFFDAERESKVIDLDAIWRRQSVPEELRKALLRAAELAYEIITSPAAGIRNMSEWAKKQACWSQLQNRKIQYDRGFSSILVDRLAVRETDREERNRQGEENRILAQSDVISRGSQFWRDVLARGVAARKLTPKDTGVLQVCAAMPHRLPSELQAKHALSVLDRLTNQGVMFD